MATKVHLSVKRPVPFAADSDSFITRSLCNRSRTLADGMNLTDDHAAVTCKFCLNIMADEMFAKRYVASLHKNPRAA